MPGLVAAAAALPNVSTAPAEIVLPPALGCECGGTFLLSGAREVKTSALLPPPAGVPTAAEIVAALATAAGASAPGQPMESPDLSRLGGDVPAGAGQWGGPPGQALVLARTPMQFGCGTLTGHGSWQSAVQPLPELRISLHDAAESGVANLAVVTVTAGERSVRARARVAPELEDWVMVLSGGFPQSRALIPAQVDAATAAVLTGPAAASVGA